ncbi:hypothetical protein BJ912DRAFT_939212 [Pholiota molesta]|nr:hypothetical protein BJ912DRAFT_939212 [Pholiota molesta]
MAEPFAAGVLNSLLQPRVPLARVTRSQTAHSTLAANFFTPLPRQTKQKARAANAPPAVGHTHILECQAWAYPLGKQALWGHDGSMRTALMGEIEPGDTRVRMRRPSKSSRPRFHKPLTPPEKTSGRRRYHVSYSSAAQPARDYSGSSFGSAVHYEAADEQPVASTSAPPPLSPWALFQEALQSGTLASDHHQLSEQFSALEASGRLAELPSYELLQLAEVLADKVDTLCIYQPDASVVCEWGQRLRSLLELVDENAPLSNFPVDSELVKSISSRSAAFMGDFMEAQDLDEHQDLPAPNKTNLPIFDSHTSDIAAALNHLFIESPSNRKRFCAKLEGNLLLLFTRHNMRLVIAAMTEWDSATRNEIFDFVLLALIEKRNYIKSFDIILEIRRTGVECPSNLLVETCKGLASTNEMEKAEELFSMPPDKKIDPAINKAVDAAAQVENFNAMYPKGLNGIRTPRPTIQSCGALMFSFLNARDYRAGIELWEDMKLHDMQPDLVLATQVIKCYCSIEDTVGLMDTLEYLKKINFKGDNVFYTIMIRYFTVHIDPTAAAAVFDEAIANNIVPDKLMYRNLMPIALFQKLRSSVPEVMDVHTYNIVLQGALFMGAPFRTLLKMFITLEKQGLAPNKFTYAILTRGAVDAGQYAFIGDLYKELMSKENWKELVDIGFMTDVITGYLRMSMLPRAKKVLDQVDKLGLKRTAVTHKAIIKAYAESKEGGMQIAEEYLRKIVTDPSDTSWKDVEPGTLRKDPLALMYGPVIDKRCSMDDPEAAERLIGEYLNHGGKPTIGILKALLGMYGRLNRLDDFRSVWNHLLELAIKPDNRSQRAPDTTFVSKMRSITAPLDIYTQTLSKAGSTARSLRRGHDFDASNWHAFAHASLRAGQIENAFQIMEYSFQPKFNAGLRNHFEQSPSLDATHEEKVNYYMRRLYSMPPPRALISPEDRVRAAHVNRVHNRDKTVLADEEAIAIDFAFPLNLMRRIGAHWHDWKPRMALLETGSHPGAATTENRGETEPLLKQLHKTYPRTMHRLRRFRWRETLQLGGYGFRKKYIECR